MLIKSHLKNVMKEHIVYDFSFVIKKNKYTKNS